MGTLEIWVPLLSCRASRAMSSSSGGWQPQKLAGTQLWHAKGRACEWGRR